MPAAYEELQREIRGRNYMSTYLQSIDQATLDTAIANSQKLEHPIITCSGSYTCGIDKCRHYVRHEKWKDCEGGCFNGGNCTKGETK